jgi:hypothetical protein
MARPQGEQPDQSRDVIVQKIYDEPERWGVFVDAVLISKHEAQMEAELAGEELAHARGIDAWLMLAWGKSRRL